MELSLNLIGDVAGNYHTLMALVKQMPKGEFVSLGDMVDRGPHSKQVLEWFKSNGSALLGNHEHMMLDYILRTRRYHRSDWFNNGGAHTLKSFEDVVDENGDLVVDIPKELIDWVQSLPFWKEYPGLFISHAPPHPWIFRPDFIMSEAVEENICWNRYVPTKRLEGSIMVYGHNADTEVRELKDEDGVYAMCIDTSRAKVLTGLHYPSMQIYQQRYID